MDREEFTAAQCAEVWGIKTKTWHSYVARGHAPQPARHAGRTPLWDAAQVRTARTQRPGAGTRTDIHRPRFELRLTDTLPSLTADLTAAADLNAELADRVEAADNAEDTLSAITTVMRELHTHCQAAANTLAARLKDSNGTDRDTLREHALRIVLYDLAADFDRLALDATGRAVMVQASATDD